MPPLPLADGRVHPRDPSPVKVAPPPLNDSRLHAMLSPESAFLTGETDLRTPELR